MHPIVPALANFFIHGLGYLLIRRRVVFGVMVLIGSVLGWVWSTRHPLPDEFFVGESLLLCVAVYLILSIAFAYDAYTEAKRK